MNSFFDNQHGHATMQQKLGSVFKFKDVSDKTQAHLKNVYGNLAICTGICAMAMYMNAYTMLTGWLWMFASMIGMAYLVYKISNRQGDEQTRIGYLWALSFCMGYLIGPAIH
jgi:uncharacterized membrane protein HdeD (DUF308 family)